jgi:hypothetical protein
MRERSRGIAGRREQDLPPPLLGQRLQSGERFEIFERTGGIERTPLGPITAEDAMKLIESQPPAEALAREDDRAGSRLGLSAAGEPIQEPGEAGRP